MQIYTLIESTYLPNIRVEVFRVVTPCSVVVGYENFRGPCSLHLHAEDMNLHLRENLKSPTFQIRYLRFCMRHWLWY